MDVLVPFDDSDPAWKALEFALRQHTEDAITVLHVIDPTYPYGDGGGFVYDDLIESLRDAANELVEEASARAAENDVSLTTKTVVGQPAREIVEYAEEHGIDQIIIGSHGRSGASRILLGSVAERVVRRAPVPVNVIR